MSATASIDELKEDFALLPDWEERYRYVIELGRELAPFPDEDRTAANKVQGCASQVWLTAQRGEGPDPVIRFSGDSDALIVKGLVAIAFRLFSGKRASAIVALDAAPLLRELGLADHLTAQRSNGFASMIARIKAEARAALQDSSPSSSGG